MPRPAPVTRGTAPRATPATGYSDTPLFAKLGIREAARVGIVGAPEGFHETLGALPAGATLTTRPRRGTDVVVAFFAGRTELQSRLPGLRKAIEPAGGLWIAWPKRSSGVATDITEDGIRAVALPAGLVDNKVCAIDETWSGLRLVVRRELRGSAT
jgi:hypothetical protein